MILETTFPPENLIPWVRTQIAEIDLTVPVGVETLHERVSKLADRPRFESALLGFFAFTGLLMAVIGLYGVTAFMVTQRTQEVGVRMALGASRLDILRLIVWDGVWLIALGGILGLGAALAVSQVLKSLLFNVGPHDPVTFVGVSVLLGLVALAATCIPARSAMKVDPVVALRYE
jgi:putative ABC transport system permease protein